MTSETKSRITALLSDLIGDPLPYGVILHDAPEGVALRWLRDGRVWNAHTAEERIRYGADGEASVVRADPDRRRRRRLPGSLR